MSVLDWKAILDKHHVPYVEKGKNVKRGEIGLSCPWCGAADPSQHLGINLTSGWYSCWRQKSGHSGKSPLRLLMKLLRVPYARARELAGLGEGYIDPEGFDALAARLMGREVQSHTAPLLRTFLDPDASFRFLHSKTPAQRRFVEYIYGRGFEREDLEAFLHKYVVMYATEGRFASRIIFPYFLEGELVTWTGRAIGSAEIRYKDLSVDESVVPPKQTVYLFDEAAKGGRYLVVNEGPIDALKIDFYGAAHGVHAVALSTNSITPTQLYMLEELAPMYTEVLVMMDAKTQYGFVDSMRMKQELATIPNVRIVEPPFGKADAAELKAEEVVEWATQTLGET